MNEQIKNKISQLRAQFTDWYQPIDFGEGQIIHVTEPPRWEIKPQFFNDRHRGMCKWHYIIKKNLPDIKNKRVLDLGCNNGLFCLELARDGAREVIGIDRSPDDKYHSHNNYVAEDVIQQAIEVKKIYELLEDNSFDNVFYRRADVLHISKLKLGRFDIILALNILYHTTDKMKKMLNTLYDICDGYVLLQCNNAHGGRLGGYSNLQHHLDVIKRTSFKIERIDEADNKYKMPVILLKK